MRRQLDMPLLRELTPFYETMGPAGWSL